MRYTKLCIVGLCGLAIILNILTTTGVLDSRDYIPSKEYLFGCVIGYLACTINLRLDYYLNKKH